MIGIYKIENKINGKVYIGQSVCVETRWKQHIFDDRKNSLIHLAIKKYGEDNFSFNVIEECSLAELDEKEKYWINFYQSFLREKGYNIMLGGKHQEKFSTEEIIDLWEKGLSIAEIKEKLNIARDSTISKRLKHLESYSIKESHSRGAYKAFSEGKILLNIHDTFNCPVYQYALTGEYIAEYKNISAAANNFTTRPNNTDNIRMVLRGIRKTAYGYQWRKEKVEKISPCSNNTGKLIICINTQQLFLSSKQAAKWANIKTPGNIVACCKGKRKSAGKHPETGEKLFWKYYEDN